jgi:hypothetical protein
MRRQPAVLAILLLCAACSTSRMTSRLSPAHCPTRASQANVGSIRVIFDPPQAHGPSLSLMLLQVNAGGLDSLVAHPAYGVDSIPNIAPGVYRLWVRQIGYSAGTVTIRLEPGEAWCIRAHMVRDTLRLTPITSSTSYRGWRPNRRLKLPGAAAGR